MSEYKCDSSKVYCHNEKRKFQILVHYFFEEGRAKCSPNMQTICCASHCHSDHCLLGASKIISSVEWKIDTYHQRFLIHVI